MGAWGKIETKIFWDIYEPGYAVYSPKHRREPSKCGIKGEWKNLQSLSKTKAESKQSKSLWSRALRECKENGWNSFCRTSFELSILLLADGLSHCFPFTITSNSKRQPNVSSFVTTINRILSSFLISLILFRLFFSFEYIYIC